MLDDGTMFAAREAAQYLSQTSNTLYPFTVGEVWVLATQYLLTTECINMHKLGRLRQA